MALSQYVCKAVSPKTSRFLSTWTDKFDKYLLGSAPVTERHSKLLAKKDIIYGVESKYSFDMSWGGRVYF